MDKDFFKDQVFGNRAIGDLAKKLASAVPDRESLGVLQGDLERNFRGLLASAFARMDLVTREEFDVQRKVLERSREKLMALETDLERLEARLEKPRVD